MQLSEFDYDLPPDRIAQCPLEERDASRLLWLHRGTGQCEDREFRELPELLQPGDLLVANDSRVFPARLIARRPPPVEATGRRHEQSGGPLPAIEARPQATNGSGQAKSGEPPTGMIEVLLLSPIEPGVWDALARPGRKFPVGARIAFAPDLEAEVIAAGPRGERRLRFHSSGDLDAVLERCGHVPLPPYIRRSGQLQDRPEDRERYQTVYARPVGSAAAPTAGLHFTPATLDRLAARGIGWATVSLHVGLGTFQPVACERIEDHPIHSERYVVSPEAAAALAAARREGRRIVAVGTTAARVIETIAPTFAPGAGETRLFLYPGRTFQAVDALITNFHAPRSTLLMMIAAFAGLDPVRHAYQHALAAGYRFLSYGDCMFIS